MAYRRHIIAARNTTPSDMAEALATARVSEIEAANGWCWAMASVWTTGGQELLNALEDVATPYFLVTTEDGSRWRFHLRAAGKRPFDTVHEFCWIGHEPAEEQSQDDWEDLVEETGPVQVVEFPSYPPLPVARLAPLDFEDDFFQPYNDDEVDDDEEEGSYSEPTPLEVIAESYEDNGVPLPPEVLEALEDSPRSQVYKDFLALHANLIADQLAYFVLPHDRVEVLRILTGENVTKSELSSDVGNLWRFLDHLGLGPKFAEAIPQSEEPEEQINPRDPALEAIGTICAGPLHPIEDGPATVPLDEILLLARIAHYQDLHPTYLIRAEWNQSGERALGTPPAYVSLITDADSLKILIQSEEAVLLPIPRKRLGALFHELPDGAKLDLFAIGQLGHFRLAGHVETGHWKIGAASTPLSAADISAMLTIFRAAEARAPQALHDEAEVEAILNGATATMELYDALPQRQDLHLLSTERSEAEALGALIFRRRFKHRWDFTALEARLANACEEWRKIEQETAPANALPAAETVVYHGKSSRFLEADYDAPSMDRRMRINARRYRVLDRKMAELGYTVLGALVCERVGGAILRCYANASERTYGVYYTLPLGLTSQDFVTLLDDQTSLTTTNGFGEGSFRTLRILQRSCPNTKPPELHTEHRAALQRLSQRGLHPLPVDASLPGIAQAMDEFLTRRLGLVEE